MCANLLTDTRDAYAREIERLQMGVAEEAVVDTREERSDSEHCAEGAGTMHGTGTRRGASDMTATSQRSARRSLCGMRRRTNDARVVQRIAARGNLCRAGNLSLALQFRPRHKLLLYERK